MRAEEEPTVEEQLQYLQKQFERISAAPLNIATVLEIQKEDVKIANTNGEKVIKLSALKAKKGDFKPGDAILIHPESQQFVRLSPFANRGGVSTVLELDEEAGKALIENEGKSKFVPLVDGVKAGDKVVLDGFGSFIVDIVPQEKKGYQVPTTGITWDDIGGNKTAKEAMIEAIENPHKYKELYDFYGTKGAKGILLYGPPGCGKTMLGKAAATSIGAAEGFIYCKGPEVLDPYVGVAEATVRSLFRRAQNFQSESGKRAIIFIDEAEALLSERGTRNSFMEKTIVPTFLAEMDGVSDSGAIVILATNQSANLDPAVVRDGRIDRRIKIDRPDHDDSIEIAMAHMKNVPAENVWNIAEHIVKSAWTVEFDHINGRLALREYMSGALIAGVIEKAKAAAMRRDIAAGTMSGVQLPDIDSALALTVSEMAAVSLEHH